MRYYVVHNYKKVYLKQAPIQVISRYSFVKYYNRENFNINIDGKFETFTIHDIIAEPIIIYWVHGIIIGALLGLIANICIEALPNIIITIIICGLLGFFLGLFKTYKEIMKADKFNLKNPDEEK